MTFRQRLRSPQFWRKILIGEFSWRRLVRSVLFVYAVLVIIAVFFPYRVIFQPPRATYRADEPGVLLFTAHDGTRLAALHLPAQPDKPTLLYFHGNAEDLGMMRPLFEAFNELGYGVFAYDYRSYGHSGGSPNEQNSYADALAAYAYLTNQLGIAPEKIVVHGRSLGGAMAVYVAVTCRPAALILESTFVSAFRVVSRIPWLPWDKFPSLRRVPEITCPTFVLHGTSDWIIRPWHGQTLYAALRVPKQAWWITGAGHNDIVLIAGQEYFLRLREFLDQHVPARREAVHP